MPLTTGTVSVTLLLKEQTAAAHEAAEQQLLPHLSSLDHYNDYSRLLKMFYGYFYPLQTEISRFVGPDVLTDIAERRTATALLKDLQAIGADTSALPVCNHLPNIHSLPQALGALYVLEGSTLGGVVIAKMLRSHPRLHFDETNLNFFQGYGKATAARWKSLQQVLNSYGGEEEPMIRAANETFTCLNAWMQVAL